MATSRRNGGDSSNRRSRRSNCPQPPSAPATITTAAIDELTDMMALSVRQPFVELILRGMKSDEWRSSSTKIRGRVLVYASQSRYSISYERGFCGPLELTDDELNALPRGVIAGSIEIADCVRSPYGGDYEWTLANPIRFVEPVVPAARAHPVWFRPFPSDR